MLLNKKIYYGLAAGVLAVSLLAGILWKGDAEPNSISEEIPFVRTGVVGLAGANQSFTYSGEVCGRQESRLAFLVSGKIVKRNVELGSAVRPGDLLMQIDPRDIQQAVNSSEAQVSAARSQLQLAGQNLNRYRFLYEQNALSKAEYDIYQNTYDAAEAALRQVTAQYQQYINQLNYCSLYAESGGVVAGIDAETGQVVSAGQTVISVVQDGEREVEINVPENRLEELRKAKQIKVKFWALADVVVDGRVREIAPVADEVSRTYKVRISLLNPPARVKLGMTSSVMVTGAVQEYRAVFVPLSAIYQTGDTPGVWVVSNGVVKLRTVKTGEFGDGQVQVLEGLNAGDVIVTAGVHKLREGLRVSTAGEAK
jgi:RND family efflux transporter MFP subunit